MNLRSRYGTRFCAFFFQAEDGIRFGNVTGVQTCALPISPARFRDWPCRFLHAASDKASLENEQASVGLRGARGPLLVRQIAGLKIGRASCRERVGDRGGGGEFGGKDWCESGCGWRTPEPL